MNSIEKTEAVRECALDNGFEACGIAAAGNVDPENRLGDWLDSGCQAGMSWMADTKSLRQDACEKLPGAKSVIVLAKNYYTGHEVDDNDCRISRYAWGRDYHKVMRKPLRALADFVCSFEENAQAYACVDTGPVLERAWAAKAGLGWIGKNGMVLRSGLGSWFFLGVVVTTVELDADPPAEDRCGTCRRCIDACPTGAINESRAVDSRKCISYLTIENRDEVPEEFRAGVGNWVFGCDICQDICPWNKECTPTDEKDFQPREHMIAPQLSSLDEMDEASFNSVYEGTCVRRAKYEGFKRNVEVVKANIARGSS